MAKKSTRGTRQPARAGGRRKAPVRGWGSSSDPGSGSERRPPRCKFFPTGHPLPVALTLQLDAPLQGGLPAGRQQLNRPTLLIHAQDAAFVCCWFSRAIDLGDEGGNPAFWMLQKTARDTWLLCLRRVSGQLAAYHLKAKAARFPIKLKRGVVTKEFKWPPTITIDQGG
jgi:hypothetical protein